MKRLIMLLAVAAGLLVISGGPARPAGPSNIILLSVDTLRADRVSIYGYGKNTTPNLDGLIKNGLMFTDAVTNVPLTNPSFSSLFTSRYPHETGAIRNGIPMKVDEKKPTLAMILKKNGYSTAAVLSNWPLKRHLSQLEIGFDLYEDDFNEKRWLFFNDERDAKGVTECALDWLGRKPKEPFFAWVHYSDPHAPYEKHSGFEFSSGDVNNSNYDSEVAYTDHYIGALLEQLKAQGLLERTLIVFIADHGESLGEHDYVGHGRNLYQQTLRVPVAIIGPGIPKGVKESAPIQLLDLTPTILSYAGLRIPEEMLGANLMPFIKGEKPYPARTLYSETYSGAAPQVEGGDKSLNRPLWVGEKRGSVKLLYSVRYQRWEQYDIASDPGELKNQVKLGDPGFTAESDALLAWYREWEDKTVVGDSPMTDVDREKFKALGYIDTP